jgi:3-oxoacyl-[acyl-carrier protein] reductase
MAHKSTKRTVLITGASRGIGKAIRDLFARSRTYQILAPSRREMDLTDMRSVERYVRAQPGIDILINNAGINLLRNVEAIDDDAFGEMLSVNLRGPLTLMREVVPHMKARRFGRIVNMSSILGLRSKERRALYSMTKFGVNGITKAAARELGGFGILVNSVCPGFIDTDLMRGNIPLLERNELKKAIPLKRFGKPEEIAKLVRFLVSDENSYITGQTLVIDGGFLA